MRVLPTDRLGPSEAETAPRHSRLLLDVLSTYETHLYTSNGMKVWHVESLSGQSCESWNGEPEIQTVTLRRHRCVWDIPR